MLITLIEDITSQNRFRYGCRRIQCNKTFDFLSVYVFHRQIPNLITLFLHYIFKKNYGFNFFKDRKISVLIYDLIKVIDLNLIFESNKQIENEKI